MKVKIQRTHQNGRIPTYATDGAGAFDFYSAEEVDIKGLEVMAIDLGVALEVPEGHVMLLFPRSSIGKNTPLRMANSVGVIDSDYRGTIHALYENNDICPTLIKKGDRIAQGIILPIPKIEFEEVKLLSGTKRGHGRFGSTGV
ncbi:dUTP diphosphatase [Veillonella sp. 3913]|jgi:dUTP diphosphatase|uniref:dUTP diphosphatase n=1 Tax=Veillonella sp. 3913 TaxID=2490952 RepID=UPI000F8ED66B|nr:dUTP diphosphatase [Veillonella sp. 3913]